MLQESATRTSEVEPQTGAGLHGSQLWSVGIKECQGAMMMTGKDLACLQTKVFCMTAGGEASCNRFIRNIKEGAKVQRKTARFPLQIFPTPPTLVKKQKQMQPHKTTQISGHHRGGSDFLYGTRIRDNLTTQLLLEQQCLFLGLPVVTH
ncbi:unnamed protein product [Lepidochelys kempii]